MIIMAFALQSYFGTIALKVVYCKKLTDSLSFTHHQRVEPNIFTPVDGFDARLGNILNLAISSLSFVWTQLVTSSTATLAFHPRQHNPRHPQISIHSLQSPSNEPILVHVLDVVTFEIAYCSLRRLHVCIFVP